ncbi:MAG: acyltransferase family protein [Pirellulaceae bacterium]
MRTQAYIPGLHGLRAIACLAVFGVHFQQFTGFDVSTGALDAKRLLLNGNTGVAFLFLLSGFLLSLPIWNATPDTVAQPIRFGVKRVARILPAYYLCLTALVIYGMNWHSWREVQETLSHYALLQNLTDSTFYAISQPFWTLAVQAQFYVIFALLTPFLLRSRRRSEWTLLLTFLALALGSYLVHVRILWTAPRWVASLGLFDLVAPDGPVVTRSVIAHGPIFFLGAALGVVRGWPAYQNLENQGSVVCDVICGLSAAMLLLILGTPFDDVLQIPNGRYHLPYVPILLGAVLLAVPCSLLSRKFLEMPPVRWLGIVSLGFYLFHEPCLRMVMRIMAGSDFSRPEELLKVALLGAGSAIVVSTLSFQLFERPLLKLVNPRSAFISGPDNPTA